MSETTSRLGLYKPTIGERNYGEEVNTNFDILDDTSSEVDVREFLPSSFVIDGSVDYSTEFQAASDSLTNKGIVTIPPGTFSLINWNINNSIIVKGSGKNNTILKPFSTGTVLTFGGNYFGLRDIRFEHDRSFNATAVKIAASTGTTNRWFDIERVFIVSFKGAGLHIDNAIWETTISHLHMRMCGDPVQDLAALEIKNPVGDADHSNNITIKDSIINLSRYYALRAVSGKDLASYPGLRNFTFRDMMIHGGTNESDLTPYAGDSVLIDGFSDLNIDTINFALIATTYHGLVLQSSLTNRGVTAKVSNSSFTGEASGNGIKLDNTSDIVIYENEFQSNFTNDITITADSRRISLRSQNTLGAAAIIKLSDSSPAGNTTIEGVNDTIVTLSDADATPSVEQKTIFATANTGATTITNFDDGIKGQRITVLIRDDDTTIDFTGSNLKGNGGIDWSPATNDTMTCVHSGGSLWYCEVSKASITVQTLTGPGAVDLVHEITHIVTTGADALTLANGVEGQRKWIVMKTDADVGTLTPSNLGNGTTITFDDVGDSADLLFTNGAWHMMGGTATLA